MFSVWRPQLGTRVSDQGDRAVQAAGHIRELRIRVWVNTVWPFGVYFQFLKERQVPGNAILDG